MLDDLYHTNDNQDGHDPDKWIISLKQIPGRNPEALTLATMTMLET